MGSTINVLKERLIFRSMSQGGDKLAVWIKHLEKQANYCDFINIEEQIRDQVIEKTNSGELRKRALQDELSLNEIIKLAKIIEEVCYHCGSSEHKLDERCSARTMVCRICNVIGHIEKCCPEKNITRKRVLSPVTAAAAVRGEGSEIKRAKHGVLERRILLENERRRLHEELARNPEKRNCSAAIRAPLNENRFVRVIISNIIIKALISDKHSVNVISSKLIKDMKIRVYNHERKEFVINGSKFNGVVDIKVERTDKACSMMDFYVITDDPENGSCVVITSYNAKKLKLNTAF